MDYACLVWRSAARSQSEKCRCFSPSVFALLPLHLGTLAHRRIHDDLGVPYFTDHIISLTERFDWRLADVVNPLVTQLGRYLHWPSVDPSSLQQEDRDQQLVQATHKAAMLTHYIVPNWHFSTTLTGFSVLFLLLWGKCQGITRKDGARPAFLPRKV
jgi:hypothetical protein